MANHFSSDKPLKTAILTTFLLADSLFHAVFSQIAVCNAIFKFQISNSRFTNFKNALSANLLFWVAKVQNRLLSKFAIQVAEMSIHKIALSAKLEICINTKCVDNNFSYK